MGIRARILLLFVVSFGVLAMLGGALLQWQLQANFDAIEQRNALESMQQLARNLQSEIDHLDDINTDWGHWDGLYQFMVHQDNAFARSDLDIDALVAARLNLMVVLDRLRRPIAAHAIDLTTGQATSLDVYAPVLRLVGSELKRQPDSKRCGLFSIPASALILCWQPIYRSNGQGHAAGTVLMARLLNQSIVARMQRQSDLDFSLQALPVHAQTMASPGQTVVNAQTLQTTADQPGVLLATLPGLTGEPTLALTLRYARDVSRQGQAVSQQSIATLLAVAALVGVVLLVGVQQLITRRLHRISQDLQQISAGSRWSDQVEHADGGDELSLLARNINHLLDVIHRQVRQLESLSHTDALTQIANRRAFDQRLRTETEAIGRNGQPLSLLVLDVDYFKRYNDHHGHPAGDTVLAAIGELLKQTAARPTDLSARLGGEEFAILLPHTDLAGARVIAERLRGALAQRALAHGDSPIGPLVTVSIGITAAHAGDAPLAVLSRADQALYQAKRDGRDRVCILHPPR